MVAWPIWSNLMDPCRESFLQVLQSETWYDQWKFSPCEVAWLDWLPLLLRCFWALAVRQLVRFVRTWVAPIVAVCLLCKILWHERWRGFPSWPSAWPGWPAVQTCDLEPNSGAQKDWWHCCAGGWCGCLVWGLRYHSVLFKLKWLIQCLNLVSALSGRSLCPIRKLLWMVDPRIEGRPLIGTAIFSKLRSRAAKLHYPTYLWDSCRVCCSAQRVNRIEVLLASFCLWLCHEIPARSSYEWCLFGFSLWSCSTSGSQSLPAFSLFREIGAVEAFSYFKVSRGVELPATCLGSTRNDTAIFHPSLAPLNLGMYVDVDHPFDSHIPLVVTLDCTRELPSGNTYIKQPLSQSFDVAQMVDSEQTEQALLAWSHAVERAVDKAMSISHHLNPFKHPWPSLHRPKYKGRCNPSKVVTPIRLGTVRGDFTGAFNPDVDFFPWSLALWLSKSADLSPFGELLTLFGYRWPFQGGCDGTATQKWMEGDSKCQGLW